ncbi:cell envelope-related transcriptional attenuator domain family protein [Leptolyngbya sp. NIES-3755]|nr:cell envelope-related transcriptional attenuator domain family protein [Leptolyngbya sp. NIES-3755]
MKESKRQSTLEPSSATERLMPESRSTVPRTSPQKPSLGRTVLWVAGLLGAATISATLGTTLALLAPLPGTNTDQGRRLLGDLWTTGFQYKISRPVNVLVMGIDRVLDAPPGSDEVFSGRSDTMLLLRVDPTDNSVNMLSIPRDTQVEIPGVGVTKINQANASGGPLLARETISRTLNGITIDRYVRVSTDAFRELVDLLGGIEVYVPERMEYTDNTQKLKIDLQPGWQTLDGDKAEQFARFRHDSFGDIGRVQRQQALIKALRAKLTSPSVIPRIPSLIGAMQKYIDTNLSLEEMLALVNLGQRLDRDDFKMVLLPGRFSAPNEFRASYWIMDTQGRDRVLQEYFKDSSTVASSEPPLADLKVAIQNASGDPQAGKQFAEYLASLGYTNVYQAENWKDLQQKTQIIVQRGDLQGAKVLQSSMGFGRVEATSTGELDSDLTIRIGSDWQTQRSRFPQYQP